MENKLFSSTLAKKKELKTYLVLFWDNAEYLGLYLACITVLSQVCISNSGSKKYLKYFTLQL